MNELNQYDIMNMSGESIEAELCPFCGRQATERHHIVPRSHGGGRGPTITVCGFGNTSGCHGRMHEHTLHLRWRDGRWEYLETSVPAKIDSAMQMSGWRKL